MKTMKNNSPNVMRLLLAAAACAGSTLPACADDATAPAATPPATAPPSIMENPTAPPDESQWRFGLTLPAWVVGINGNATVLGHQQNVNIDFSKLRDHLDNSISLGLDVSKGKFGLYGDVGYMKFSGGFTGPLGGNTAAQLKFILEIGRAHV